MARQQELAGMERPNGDKHVDELAEAFARSCKARKRAQTKEVVARAALIAGLKEKNLNIYEDKNADPPLLVTLVSTDKVTVIAVDGSVDIDADNDDVEVKELPAAGQRAKKKPTPAEA